LYLQASLAGARSLHAGLVVILLADSAFYQDSTARLPAILDRHIARSRCGGGHGRGLPNGGLKTGLRQQPACHHREMVCHGSLEARDNRPSIRMEGVEARKKDRGGRQAEGEGLRRGVWISEAPREWRREARDGVGASGLCLLLKHLTL